MSDKEQQTPPQRGLTEPPTGQVLLGPREGFVENIQTNLALIQKRIKHEDFQLRSLTIGKYTQTQVTVAYINSIADPTIIKTVMRRLKKINCDGIIDT